MTAYKKVIVCLSGIAVFNIFTLNTQNDNTINSYYQNAYNFINGMLEENIPLSFKNAVYKTENAFYNGELNKDDLNEEIEVLAKLANIISNTELINYGNKDKETIIRHASLFRVMTDRCFMGNTVSTDANGNVTVSARQEVNPNVLGSADAHTNTPGKMMMHEATEAYEGAKISQKAGVSSPRSGMPGSVYEKAHNRATSQTTIYETIYDKAGNKLQMLPGGAYPPNITKVEWHVTKNGKSKIIQTYP